MQRGLVFEHRSGHAGRHLFPEILGGGGALFDMDGDGDLDAYLVQSGTLDPEEPSPPNQLFRNDGRGRFTDVTAESGAGDRGYGMGVAAGDYDNDGDVDLYVTNYGPNVLLANDGQGRFTDVTASTGVGDPSWGTSAAFLDYDTDGDLDLFITNYINWSPSIEQDCYNASGVLGYCDPTNYGSPARDQLYRNDGGVFVDATRESGIDATFGNGLGALPGDFDGNGHPDLFVANDTMVNQLWLNVGGDRFRDESLLRGCAVDEHGIAKAGMGVATADYDDDGDLDLLVVNLENQTDSFFRNDDGYFTDYTGAAGLGSVSRRFTRFGVGLVDFDNDGWLDLYEANGRVVAATEPWTEDRYAEPNLLFRGSEGGRFSEVLPRGGTRELLIATSRAAAFGDVDGDGGVDVLVVNRDGPAHLLLNVVPDRGRWVRFRVVDRHGRDALGAIVRFSLGARRIRREVQPAGSYAAASDSRVHVGLGDADGVEAVEVRWPDGTTESFGGVAGGDEVLLRQGAGGG